MNELSLALRRLRRRPGRSVVGVITLALGIGASTAAFSAVLAVLLSPLPVHEQDDLVVLWRQSPSRDFVHVPFTPRGVDLVADGVPAFSASAGFDIVGRTTIADRGDRPFGITYRRVTGPFFDVLGVEPQHGRFFEADDDVYGAEPVVVLGHGFWTSATGSDPDVIGSTLTINDVSFRVVGVAGPGLDFPRGTQLWATLRGSGPPPAEGRPGAELDVVARLAAGVQSGEAVSRTEAAFLGDAESAELARSLDIVATPLAEHVVGSFERVLEAGMGVAMLLLLVAVANATLLFLSGGARVRQEIAARRALGASRWRVAVPLLADASVLAALGTAFGVFVAGAIVVVLLPMAPADLPRLDQVALDGRSVAFACAVALLAMVGSGGVAGWWLSRGQPGDALSRATRGFGTQGEGLRKGIAAAQIALAVVAAVGAGLLARTVGNLDGLDRGFSPESVYLVGLQHGYPIFEVPDEYVGQLETLARTLERYPEIAGATPTMNRPLDFNAGIEMSPAIEGQDADDARARPYMTFDGVLPGYFDVMGMNLLEGRLFGGSDDGSAERVVVVNESAADILWPGESALGRRLSTYPGEPDAWGTVVGVVADSRYRSFLETRPAVWVPLRQYSAIPPGILIVRTAVDGAPVRTLVSAALAEAAPGVRALTVSSLDEVMATPLLLPRFAAAVLLTSALITLLLAGLGVYGVFSVLVQERRQELGLRRALGARHHHVLGFVAHRVLTVCGAGAVVGTVASTWLSTWIESLLFGVTTVDTATLAAVLAATLATAVVAAWAPAARAARTEPARALRAD